MPKTLEVPPDERKRLLETAPPLAATATVEATRGMPPVQDTISKIIVDKSNTSVRGLLDNTLKSTMKLAKTSFGSVAQVFTVFSGLKRIIGGI
jgi:hypothetical protein